MCFDALPTPLLEFAGPCQIGVGLVFDEMAEDDKEFVIKVCNII